jgi:hypothetical protein
MIGGDKKQTTRSEYRKRFQSCGESFLNKSNIDKKYYEGVMVTSEQITKTVSTVKVGVVA